MRGASVKAALLGDNAVDAPTNFQYFLQGVADVYPGGKFKKPRSGRQFKCAVVNTDARGRGFHWLQASAIVRPDGPVIKLLEPYGSKKTISDHVHREFRSQLRGVRKTLDYKKTGVQADDDNWRCGYISTWSDVTTKLSLRAEIDMSDWEPDPT